MSTELDRRFLEEGLSLLQVVARRIARRLGNRVPVDDLLDVGRPALLEIVRSYDPARSSFTVYARYRLTWAILDGIRRETGWRSELSRATALAASEQYAEGARAAEVPAGEAPEEHQQKLGELLAGHAAALALGLMAGRQEVDEGFPDGRESPEEHAAAAELSVALRRAVAELPARERALIERHYYGGERFDRIAEDLGISKSWASRLHAQGIEQLGRALRRSLR